MSHSNKERNLVNLVNFGKSLEKVKNCTNNNMVYAKFYTDCSKYNQLTVCKLGAYKNIIME